MGFHDVQFPTNISYGSRGGPGFSTSIIRLLSGAEERVDRWAAPLYSYDASYGIRSVDDLYTVLDFYIVRKGAAHSFRYSDPLDYNTSANGRGTTSETDVVIGTGDGTTTAFSVFKNYGVGTAYVLSRPIKLTVAGSSKVTVDAVSQTEGVDYTIDDTQGIITFSTAPPLNDVVTAGFGFDVQCRFGGEIDEALQAAITGFEAGSITSIPIQEVRNEAQVPDVFPFGGAINHGTTAADLVISLYQGRVHRINPSTSGVVMKMPDATTLPLGGPYFYIFNESGSNTIELQNNAGTTLHTLATSSGVEVVLGADASAGKTWYAYA